MVFLVEGVMIDDVPSSPKQFQRFLILVPQVAVTLAQIQCYLRLSVNIYIYIHTLHYITLHCITSHHITLHYITLQYITLHYITYIHTITYIR